MKQFLEWQESRLVTEQMSSCLYKIVTIVIVIIVMMTARGWIQPDEFPPMYNLKSQELVYRIEIDKKG